jgi:putative transposase
MANTYTQIYVQLVFAVGNRLCLIHESHRESLQKYITGIVTNRRCKLISIYCMPNHCHIFIGLNPEISVSNLVRDIKTGSTRYINDRNWYHGRYFWQRGYGAFSYSRSQIKNVASYIETQPAHHKKLTFREEYLSFLQKFEISYEDQYLYEWFE